MAAAWSLAILPLTDGLRKEDWKPIFLAATSTLVASAGEKSAIQILPSLLVRHEYEKAICLEAIKEETLEAAFEVLQENLDPAVDVFEATQQYRSIVWNVGERLDDFFMKLWQVAIRKWLTKYFEQVKAWEMMKRQ